MKAEIQPYSSPAPNREIQTKSFVNFSFLSEEKMAPWGGKSGWTLKGLLSG